MGRTQASLNGTKPGEWRAWNARARDEGGGRGAKASRTVAVGWVFFVATESRHTILRAEALARDNPIYGDGRKRPGAERRTNDTVAVYRANGQSGLFYWFSVGLV